MIGSLSVSIDRTSLSLSPLVADGESDASGYLIERDGFGMVGGAWDRTVAEARGWHGGVLVDARMVNGQWILPYRVVGSSAAQVTTRRRALQDAVSQFAYVLTITQDDIAETWDAQPADWSTGGEIMFDGGPLYVWQTTLTVPVYPIPGV